MKHVDFYRTGLDLSDLQETAAHAETPQRDALLNALAAVVRQAIPLQAIVGEPSEVPAAAQAMWVAAFDPKDGRIVFAMTGEAPWTFKAARQAKAQLRTDGMPPEDDELGRLASRGATTLAVMFLGRTADGKVSVLYGRHPAADDAAIAELVINNIENQLSLRTAVN